MIHPFYIPLFLALLPLTAPEIQEARVPFQLGLRLDPLRWTRGLFLGSVVDEEHGSAQRKRRQLAPELHRLLRQPHLERRRNRR